MNSEFGEAYLCMYMETRLKLGYGGSAKKSEMYFGLLRVWEPFTFSYQSQAEMDEDRQHILSRLQDFSIVPLSPVSTEQKNPFAWVQQRLSCSLYLFDRHVCQPQVCSYFSKFLSSWAVSTSLIVGEMASCRSTAWFTAQHLPAGMCLLTFRWLRSIPNDFPMRFPSNYMGGSFSARCS